METHQPPVNDEWGVDMEEAIDVFNMDVGDTFGASESGNQTRTSSTRIGKSQTYVHMTNNAVHIKTLIAEKEAPQGPEDFRQVNQVIQTGPIGRVGRKHAIISNAEAITKEGFEQDKEIRSLRKEVIALKRRLKELESIKVPTERLKRCEPLLEGMDEVKREVIDEALAMVTQFVNALTQVSHEEQRLKHIVTTRINLLRRLESRRPIIEECRITQETSDEDVLFCSNYWFYLDTIRQIASRFQEVQKDIVELGEKVTTSLELMTYEVRFLEDSVPRKPESILAEVRNLLQCLIQTEDVNTYRTGGHLRHMLKAHAWKLEMRDIVVEVDAVIGRNKPKVAGMLRGLEMTAQFLDDGFEDRVASMDPPQA